MELTPAELKKIEQDIRAKATRRVRARIGLMWHVAVYAMASGAMIAINLNYSPHTNWFVWPVCAWGAAVVLHAIATLQVGGQTTEDMIQAEIAREKARRGLT